MNVSCPGCQRVYRVDPARVPAGGVRARCGCGQTIPVPLDSIEPVFDDAQPAAAGGKSTAGKASSRRGQGAVAPAAAAAAAIPAVSPFGPQDRKSRALRLARALISDIVAYDEERRNASLARGTLRTDFHEEVLKSWNEYVEQVGIDVAKGTTYFRDALNEILARGQKIF